MPGKGHSPLYAHAFPLFHALCAAAAAATHTYTSSYTTSCMLHYSLSTIIYISRVVVVGQIFTRGIRNREGEKREIEGASSFFVHTLQYTRRSPLLFSFFATPPCRMVVRIPTSPRSSRSSMVCFAQWLLEVDHVHESVDL